MSGHFFNKKQLEIILNRIVNKTLGEVDANKVFDRTITNPKITGIAGDVIEQSVLNYPADTRQGADLDVDGTPVELKVTGIRESKKQKGVFEAKEPMSITAVSIDKIVYENFETSKFWEKSQNTLLVYYQYMSATTVMAAEYANFPIKGYQFHTFTGMDKERLKNDWTLVRDFIINIQQNYAVPENEYPRISSELRKELLYLDTAPKYPNPPRFRLKRSVVSSIMQKHFEQKSLEMLPDTYLGYRDIDFKCNSLTIEYKNATIKDLKQRLGIYNQKVSKSIAEPIIAGMFGAKESKLNKIELFQTSGIFGKSIVFTSKGARTEDTKLFQIDFEEWTKEEAVFEESVIYDYFANHQLLFVVFEEPSSDAELSENVFKGFKRLSFSDEFIYGTVKKIWEEVRDLVNNDLLKKEIVYSQKTGEMIVNKNGTLKTVLNFPKSKENVVFLRGSGEDSSKKPLVLNGIAMYNQWVWIKGSYLVKELSKLDFL